MKKFKWGIVISTCLFISFMLPLQGFSKGGSSFGGGSSRSSSSFSSSKSSGGGFSSSKSFSGGSSPSKPSSSSSGGLFSNSKGSSATTTTPSKSQSSFSTGVNAGIASKSAEPPSSPTGMKSTGTSPSNAVSKQLPPATRTVIVNRTYVAPSAWTPSYYHYSYGYSPVGEMVDFWYKMEMLRTMRDMNERNRIMSEMKYDPNYEKWKREAQTQAENNPELKKDLDGIDKEMVSINQVQQPVKKKSGISWMTILFMLAVLGVIVVVVRRYYK